MIVYFDTSAVVPLVIAEESTARCRMLWRSADVAVTSALTFVEAHAAIAQAHRMERLDASAVEAASGQMDALWREFTVISPDEEAILEAARLAHTQSLRGYDAVHCATALRVADEDFAAAAGDRRLLDAWHHLGLTTIATLP